jgi:hypothetical protein
LRSADGTLADVPRKVSANIRVYLFARVGVDLLVLDAVTVRLS